MNLRFLLLMGLLIGVLPRPAFSASTDQSDAPPTQSMDSSSFDAFMQNYYKAPHPADISRSLTLLDQPDFAIKLTAKGQVFMFYSCVFGYADAAQRAIWWKEIYPQHPTSFFSSIHLTENQIPS